MALSYNLGYQESISVHPTRRQIFAGKPYSTFANIWEWVISCLQEEILQTLDLLKQSIKSIHRWTSGMVKAHDHLPNLRKPQNLALWRLPGHTRYITLREFIRLSMYEHWYIRMGVSNSMIGFHCQSLQTNCESDQKQTSFFGFERRWPLLVRVQQYIVVAVWILFGRCNTNTQYLKH